MTHPFKKIVAGVLIASTLSLGFQMPAQASIVSTEEVQANATASAERDKVNQFLQRQDVRDALVGHGVTAQAAQERVRALTDAEVTQLAEHIDQAPAGGGVLSVLLTIFVVLLITDLLGWTKVFPFTRTIR